MLVPASVAELNAGWLPEALAESEAVAGAQFTGVSSRIIGVGYGLDGTVAHLTLTLEGGRTDAPTSLVAKLAPSRRRLAEVAFYESIAAHMPVRLAHYYAGFSTEEGDRAGGLDRQGGGPG